MEGESRVLIFHILHQGLFLFIFFPLRSLSIPALSLPPFFPSVCPSEMRREEKGRERTKAEYFHPPLMLFFFFLDQGNKSERLRATLKAI